jgi:hypothetical protein
MPAAVALLKIFRGDFTALWLEGVLERAEQVSEVSVSRGINTRRSAALAPAAQNAYQC